MSKARSQSIALLLNQEITAVVTALRQNSKWAMVPTRYTRMQDDEMGDEPLLEDFKVLRRRIFHWHDWSDVDPLEYLGPFLEVIKSPETSGPITGTALTSVARFLDHDIIGEFGNNVAEVMRTTAVAVTNCKFESIDPASDDTVLFKILQVLLACFKSPGGRCLTDHNVTNIIYACFKIGHYAGGAQKDPSGRHADLLTAASREVMVELVAKIFGEMGALPSTPKNAHPRPGLLLSEGLRPPEGAPLQPPKLAEGALPVPAENGVALKDEARPPSTGQDPSTPELAEGKSASPPETGAAESAGGPGLAGVSVLSSKAGRADDDSEHGMDSIIEVLGFIIGLINSEGEGSQADLNVFGLELMNVALNSGLSEFARHEDLMVLLREDLWQALFQAVRTMQLGTLAGAGQVALSLWIHLGSHLLLQLEAFLQLILLRLAQGSRNGASQHQEASLEVLLDLCNQQGFVRTVYANLDCRVERSDLFENICALLSKTAFPVNSPLGSVHLHSLEGLFSILNALSKGCTGMSVWDGLEEEVSSKDSQAVWESCCRGSPPPLLMRRQRSAEMSEGDLDSPHSRAKAKAEEERRGMIETALLEKLLKNRLSLAAEHFNRDYKKGFLYLQSIHLLDAAPKAQQVARFLRFCPGLSKQTIGELLGEHDSFYLEVLEEFTDTFDFKGLSFDRAMRQFLESFRLPGEAQKINRIMESFGSHYHKQCPLLFKNADAVYILAYSVILLNTDQHNSQVKKKMNCDDFIRNNRGINGGDNLPQEFLRSLYESISRNEIRISSEASAAAAPVLWTQLAQSSTSPRGIVLSIPNLGTQSLDKQMFGLMWGPTVAAVSVVLDHAEDPQTVRHALDGLLLAAKIAAFHHVDEVMDSLVVSLSKFTASLDPAAPKPALAFGENEKARLATHTLFMLATRYGDSLRSGWKNLLACVMRLFQLNLLPPSVLLLESEDSVAARERIPRPSASRRTPATASLLSRAFSSLISIDSGESAEARPRETAASQNTAACIEECRLDELFADSKFLRAESLIELVKAIMWASGPVNRIAASGEESDTAEVGLELVIVVALRNRDRLLLIWPLVHDMLATILAPETARATNPLVRRAALGLLRICRRLLPYKADSADALLKSMQMVLRLDATVAWELAPAIAEEVLQLVKSSGESIRASHGWRTVCLLISSTSLKPQACPVAAEALLVVAKDPILSPVSFTYCLETATALIENNRQEVQPEAGLRALQALHNMFGWLVLYNAKLRAAGGLRPDAEGEELAGPAEPLGLGSNPVSPTVSPSATADPQAMWSALLKLLVKVSVEQQPRLRNEALQLQHRVMMGSDPLQIPPRTWLQTLTSELLPLTAHFAHKLASARREAPLHSPPLRSSLKLLSKALLHYLPALAEEPGFPEMWTGLLQLLQDCTRTKSEELTEVVPEALKNILLVMAAQGVLTPTWQDAEGNSLWELTWHRAQAVSSGLTPSLLLASGVVLPAASEAGAVTPAEDAGSPPSAEQDAPPDASPAEVGPSAQGEEPIVAAEGGVDRPPAGVEESSSPVERNSKDDSESATHQGRDPSEDLRSPTEDAEPTPSAPPELKSSLAETPSRDEVSSSRESPSSPDKEAESRSESEAAATTQRLPADPPASEGIAEPAKPPVKEGDREAVEQQEAQPAACKQS